MPKRTKIHDLAVGDQVVSAAGDVTVTSHKASGGGAFRTGFRRRDGVEMAPEERPGDKAVYVR